jgi:putative component of toxin-antitoxin plasmid stabilization module
MSEFRYYVAADGVQPFAEWFAELEPVSRAKVTRALVRLQQGNFSNVKSVGEGVLEIPDQLRAGVPRLFRARRRSAADFVDGRHEEAPAMRHRGGPRLLARL